MPLLAIVAIGALVVGYVLQAFVMKQPKQQAATLDDFDVPQVADGTPQAVVFGDGWIDGWQVLWYGNYRTSKIKKKGQTIGFKYFMSLLMGLCRGPVDEIVEIEVGDKQAYQGHLCNDSVIRVDKPNLFGGDEKEGGIDGRLSVFMGALNQVLPGARFLLPDVRAAIGGLVSQMRGVTTVWYDGEVSALSPYLKPWSFRVRRTRKGWYKGLAWYPEKATIYLGGEALFVETNAPIDLAVTFQEEEKTATVTFARNVKNGDTFTINGVELTIGDSGISDDDELGARKSRAKSIKYIAGWINTNSTRYKTRASYTDTQLVLSNISTSAQINAMNASHIVYQSYTDPLWGRGFPEQRLDENAFIYAANKLCAEGFGLCLIWYRKEDIDVFIQKVCELVGGLTYTDRETGLIVFKLVRDDYDRDTIPHFTPETGLIDITEDDSASSENSYNEIIGTSLSPITNLEFQVRAQNLAARQAQGAPSSMDQDYKGIPNKDLLGRIITRDLRAMSIGLKKYTVVLDRRGWRVTPGSVFRMSFPGRGLENVIVRVGEIDDGDLVNGRLVLKVAIDVFGLPATSYMDVAEDGWVPPSKIAVEPPEHQLVEMGYRDLLTSLGAANAQVLPQDAAYAGQLATAPNPLSTEYQLVTRTAGEPGFVDRGAAQFTGSALLLEDIGPAATAIKLYNLSMFDTNNVGQVVLIEDELVRLETVNVTTGEATVARGVADTVPVAHEADAVLWTIDDDLFPEGVQRQAGDMVQSKALTLTSEDRLEEDAADEDEITLTGRPARPYPPAAVTVDGVSIYANRDPSPEPVIAWASRNRITQGSTAVAYDAASIEPEAGTTYRIGIFDIKTNALLRMVGDITETTWTYAAAMSAEDGAPSRVGVVLESVRDGLASYQQNRFTVALKGGWGYGWGTNWGG